VLVTFYFSTNGEQWLAKDGWLNYTVHECDWFTTYNNPQDGICSQDSEDSDRLITDLMQWGNNLDGPLPP